MGEARLTRRRMEARAPDAKDLAGVFSSVVRERLADHLDEIRRRNRASAAAGERNVCATHDFCDANMLMHEALCRCYGVRDFPASNISESETLTGLWNEAWDIAKRNEFLSPGRVRARTREAASRER